MIPESKITDEMWAEHLKVYGAAPQKKSRLGWYLGVFVGGIMAATIHFQIQDIKTPWPQSLNQEQISFAPYNITNSGYVIKWESSENESYIKIDSDMKLQFVNNDTCMDGAQIIIEVVGGELAAICADGKWLQIARTTD